MPNKKTKIERVPPHDTEAEQAVLASVIIDTKVIDELVGFLNEDDFYEPAHKYIYRAIQSLHFGGKAVDLVTLISRLKDEETLEKAGGMEYVAELVQIIPNSANIAVYAKNIHEKSILRKMISLGGEISDMGFNTIDPVDDLVDKTQLLAFDLGSGGRRDDAVHIETLMKESFDNLERLYSLDENEKFVSGITSGFPDLDKITNGFQKSDLIIVAGRPGMGKTSFGLNVLINAASSGKVCVFFSLEMSSHQLVNRLISCEAEIGSAALRTGSLNQDQWKRLAETSESISKMQIYLDDTPQITVNQIRAKCRRLASKGKLDMVFVDYLQIMGYNKSIQVREQQISEISRSLKSLAKEFNIPVMAFAQVNRSVDSRGDNRRPFLSDLRESGAIEQDADIIMFLYRDAVYNPNSILKDTAEVIIAKHRNGETGSIPLSFDANFTRFGKRPVDIGFYKQIIDGQSKRQSRKKTGEE